MADGVPLVIKLGSIHVFTPSQDASQRIEYTKSPAKGKSVFQASIL